MEFQTVGKMYFELEIQNLKAEKDSKQSQKVRTYHFEE
jgi:hypothetical protein